MLCDLAEHEGDGYIALKEIAERQGISKKYLEQIVPVLNRAEVLQAKPRLSGRVQAFKVTRTVYRGRDSASDGGGVLRR